MVWQSYTQVGLLIHARIYPMATAFASSISPRIVGGGAEKSPAKNPQYLHCIAMWKLFCGPVLYCGTIIVIDWHVRLAAHINSG